MIETFLQTAVINNNDILGALNEAFDGTIDADWTGENPEEFWTEYAREQNKSEKQIANEFIGKIKNELTPEEIIERYIAFYKEAYGGYYDVINYRLVYVDNVPKVLVVVFVREN